MNFIMQTREMRNGYNNIFNMNFSRVKKSKRSGRVDRGRIEWMREQWRRQPRIKCEKLITMSWSHVGAFLSAALRVIVRLACMTRHHFCYNHFGMRVHTNTHTHLHISFSMSFVLEHTFLLLLFSLAIIIYVRVFFHRLAEWMLSFSFSLSYQQHNDIIYEVNALALSHSFHTIRT